jgi:hypothetical protein
LNLFNINIFNLFNRPVNVLPLRRLLADVERLVRDGALPRAVSIVPQLERKRGGKRSGMSGREMGREVE